MAKAPRRTRDWYMGSFGKIHQVAFAAGIAVRGAKAVHKDLCARKRRYALIEVAFLTTGARIERYFLNTGFRAFQEIVDMPVTLLVSLPQMAR